MEAYVPAGFAAAEYRHGTIKSLANYSESRSCTILRVVGLIPRLAEDPQCCLYLRRLVRPRREQTPFLHHVVSLRPRSRPLITRIVVILQAISGPCRQ